MNNSHFTGSKIAVVGAGTMGCHIAYKYAVHGFFVTLMDQNEDNLRQSQALMDSFLAKGVAKGIYSLGEAEACKDRLRFTTILGDCQDAELVIEAIFEDLSLKKQLFRELDALCDKRSILATNTSSLRVLDLQEGLGKPERLLGLHYFYPASINRLVEVISTPLTDESALEKVIKIQERIKKVIIISKDSPGFIINRFFVPWLNEAMRIIDENVANIATVEAAAQQLFHIKMGPFELMNLTGLPISLHALKALAHSLGDFYTPSPLLAAQISSQKPWPLSGPIKTELIHPIGLRLLSVVASLAASLIEEQVASASDIELGAQTGLMWPKGPFELMKSHSPALSSALKDFAAANPSLARPPLLQDHLASESFTL